MGRHRRVEAKPAEDREQTATQVDLGEFVTRGDYDAADQRIARSVQTLDIPVVAYAEPQLDLLVINRESDRFDMGMLLALVQQSWARNPDAPGIDQIRKAALDPLLQPERCRFKVVRMAGKHFEAAFFVIGRVGWIYSPASAKEPNERGDNEFTEAIVALILTYRPRVLDAVSFTRLVRALEHSPRLLGAVAQVVEQVRAGNDVLDFKHNPQFAHMLWAMLSAASAAGRDEFERQKIASLLTRYDNGEWILGPRHVPFGYHYNASTKMIEWDPARREAVIEMWKVFTSGLPASTQVQHLIALGVLSEPPAHATSALRARIRWGPVWVNGIWIQYIANPIPGIEEYLGHKVRHLHAGDQGLFELLYRPGPPDGVLPDSLKKPALTLVRAIQRPRQGGKRSRHGLVGFQWLGRIGTRRGVREWRIGASHDELEIRVRPHRTGPRPVDRPSDAGSAGQPDTSAREQLLPSLALMPFALVPTGDPTARRERPAYGVAARTWSAEAGQNGALLATPTIRELGTTLALLAAGALRRGVLVDDITLPRPETWQAGDQGVTAVPVTVDQKVRECESEIAHLQQRAHAARENALVSKERATQHAYTAEADAAEREVRRLQADLGALQSASVAELALPDDALINPVVAGLTRLATAEAASDMAEPYAVHQMVRDVCMTVDGLLLRGSFRLAVPTRTREVILGPISFVLPNRCRNGAAIWLQNEDFTARTMAPVLRPRGERQALIARLRGGPRLSPRAAELAAGAFLAAVPALLLGEPSGERARAWKDAQWAAHLRQTYTGRLPRVGRFWFQMDVVRQGLAYAVADAGGTLSRGEVTAVLAGFGVAHVNSRIHQFTVAQRDVHLQRSTSWDNWPPAVVRVREPGSSSWHAEIRRCPRCGGPAELVVNAPEIPFACMCPCGGAPGLDIPVPTSYRKLVPTRAQVEDYATACAEQAAFLAGALASR